MSDRLKLGLSASTSEIEAGLTEAETELERLRQRARELQELIALGKLTLLASRLDMSWAAPAAPVVRIPEAPSKGAEVPAASPASTPPPMPAVPAPDPTALREKLGRAAESRSAGPQHAVEAAEQAKPSRSKK